jgi:Tfp pilus assembly protein PilN
MIQLNLLPDVKMSYVKANRLRRLVISVSFIATAVCIFILFLFFAYNLTQKKRIDSLTNQITSSTNQLEGKKDIDQVLTVQKQLSSLNTIDSTRTDAGILFNTYLNELLPADASVSNIVVTYSENGITLQGSADSLATVDTFVDTLKFTTYTTKTQKQPLKAFSNVVLTSFGLNTQAAGATVVPNQEASYGLTFDYDPNIFSGTKSPKLKIPSLVTTRSELAQPTDLFVSSANTSDGSKS